MTVHILWTEPQKEVVRKQDGDERWCFCCRKRRVFEYVVLSPIERAATFHRDNLRIARDTITKVQLTEDAWTWLRGVPNPGTHIPGVLAAGSWKAAGSLDFVLIRRRRPSVVIDLEGDEHYRRLILTTSHGLALTQALRLDVTDEPANVEEIVATAPVPVSKGRRRPVIRPRPA